MSEFVILRKPDGGVMVGIATHYGVLPVLDFKDMDELRKFAEGLLGFCDYFSSPIPTAFVDAFKEETNGTGES